MSPGNTKLWDCTEPAIFDSRSKIANAALKNPAVARCCEAWQHAYQEHASRDGCQTSACAWAYKAYRNAMPALSGEEDVGDFIACATHGLLIGAIEADRASKLLYAAQIALTSINRAQKAIDSAGKWHTPTPSLPAQQTVENE